MFSLGGKTALVTGAGSGIGQAIAVLFAQAGARVAVVDIDADAARETVRTIETAGGAAAAFRCDVAAHAEVEAAFTAVEARSVPWTSW